MFLKNVSGQAVAASLVSKTDGSNVTGGSCTVYVLGDAGTQGTGGGTVTDEGNSCWSYQPTQAETNYNHVAYTFVHASAVSQTVNLYPTVLNDIADAIFKRDLSAITSEARRSLLNAIRKLLNKWTIIGTTLSVKKEDDSTEAYNETLTPAAGADAFSASDPN
jgi:hypothetical protein